MDGMLTPYEEGFAAGLAYLHDPLATAPACPYDEDSLNADAWIDGFIEAGEG